MSYLFVFRSSPDVDHMVPLAWKLLEEGEEVHAVISPGYDPGPDHRFELLRGYGRFHVHETGEHAAAGRLGELRTHLRCTLPYALALLARTRARVVAVEWGYGLPAAYENLRSPEGVKAVVRSLARSFVKARSDKQQLRHNFVVAARLLGIPTVCLPHGLSVKLNDANNEQVQRLLERGPLALDDRNRFAAFVFNTEYHRQWFLDNANGDPEVMQTWGSLRWSPEWFELNRKIAPPFEWPEDTDRLKVVYMVPKWKNRVNADEAVGLLRRLQELDEVSLAVMGHPRRAESSSDPLRSDPNIDWSQIHDVTGVSSVSLIGACDVVIDVGSSIGIEVVMQGKVLVNPTYIHELETLFDTIEGTSVVAHSTDEVLDYLRGHAAGAPHRVPDDALAELMRQTVYASRDTPFDVLEEYGSRVRTLTTRGGR